jgi:CHAT domain-containing protein
MLRYIAAILILWLAIAGLARSDEPQPKPLTEEQKAKLKERDRMLKEAQQLEAAGKLDEMVAVWEKKLVLEREVFGDVHVVVARSLAVLGRLYELGDKFEAACKAIKEVLALRTKLHGENDWRVTIVRLDLQDLQMRAELQPSARQRLLKAEELYEQVVDLWKQGRAREALQMARAALEVQREILGDSHRDYSKCLNILALLYQATGDYAKALPLMEQARDLDRKLLTENHPDYATMLNNLAALHKDIGNYPKALVLHEQACELRRRVLGENDPSYAQSLNSLAALHYSMGDYTKALPLMEQARDLYEKLLTEAKALPLMVQAHDLFQKLLTENHRGYVACLNNLAQLYKAMGDYAKALSLMERARPLQEKLLNEREYATVLDNLAILYLEFGDNRKALPLAEQARDIRRKVLTEDHREYAVSLNNLAMIHTDMGDYAKALALNEQAHDLYKKLLTENHPAYATSLNNIAFNYRDMGDHAKALSLFEQVRDLRRKLQTENHPMYAESLNNLALEYHSAGLASLAGPLARQALRLRMSFLDRTLAVQSDRQRLELLNRYQHDLHVYLTCVSPLAVVTAPHQVYSDVLPWKAAAATRRAEELLARDRVELRPLADQLSMAQVSLARLAQMTPDTREQRDDWVKRFDKLEAEVEQLQRTLAEKSKDFRRFRELRKAGATEVAAVLPCDAALIDFIAYRHMPPKSKPPLKREDRLLAFVLRRSRDPVCVPLGKTDDIEKAILEWRAALGQNPDTAAARLAALVWQPLTKHIGDAKTILLAPDGWLAFVPFAALPGSKPGTYLVEELTLGYVASGRHLLEMAADTDRPASAGLLALGGLDYGPRPAGSKAVAIKDDPRGLERGPGVNPHLFLRSAYWNPLPGTRFEAESVVRAYRDRFSDSRTPLLLAGAGADADRFRRELTPTKETPRWRYLHLATHGYFQPPSAKQFSKLGFDQVRGLRTFGRNPLLMSGLVLAGANRTPDTGTLSAQEASALDLRGAEMVVLSACDTGLGRVADGEGVLGLQRAFQMAGARTVVASLWKVNDAATSVLMEEFYANLWQKKLPKLEALRQAQLTVLKNPALVRKRAEELAKAGLRAPEDAEPLPKAGAAETRSHPALWAAFVSYGDPGTGPETRK